MLDVKKALLTLGLTEDEITIYYCLLENGADTILHLAQKTSIPRTSVYVAIESLVDKELVNPDSHEGKKRYHATEPEHIIQYGKKQQQDLQNSLHDLADEVHMLHAAYSIHSGRPGIRYADSLQDIEALLSEFSQEKEYCIYRTAREDERLRTIYEMWFKHMQSKHVSIKEIHAGVRVQAVAKKQTYLFESRELPSRFAGKTDLIISSRAVLYLILRERDMFGIMIDDVLIARDEKNRFDIIWNLLEMVDQMS